MTNLPTSLLGIGFFGARRQNDRRRGDLSILWMELCRARVGNVSGMFGGEAMTDDKGGGRNETLVCEWCDGRN